MTLTAAAVEAARASAEKLMAQGVPPEENRAGNSRSAPRRTGAEIQRKVRARRGAVMRIIEDDNDND